MGHFLLWGTTFTFCKGVTLDSVPSHMLITEERKGTCVCVCVCVCVYAQLLIAVVQFAKSCLTLCDPMDLNSSGFPVLLYFLEFV